MESGLVLVVLVSSATNLEMFVMAINTHSQKPTAERKLATFSAGLDHYHSQNCKLMLECCL